MIELYEVLRRYWAHDCRTLSFSLVLEPPGLLGARLEGNYIELILEKLLCVKLVQL